MTHRRSIGVGRAAEALGVSTQTVRNWIKDGKLEGWKSPNGRWHVDDRSLRDCAGGRGATDGTIADKLDRLSADVAALGEADRLSARLLEAAERERDRYRADAAAIRDTALQLVAAADETQQAVTLLLEIMARQRDALSQLLAPGSPQDLMPIHGLGPDPV